MKDAFRGYYPPTESELAELWSDGLVILDTNALLNLFRYTEETRTAFLEVLNEKAGALWIPHQVGLEFHRRRIEVINTQEKAFADIESTLTSAKNSVQTAINKFKRHPSLDSAGMSQLLENSIQAIATGLEEYRKSHNSAVVEKHTNELTFDKITSLYDGNVGAPFSFERLQEVYKEGDARYEKKIPPGYKDQGKDGTGKYGDLVLWLQILAKGSADRKPAIFVTDDAKEDWWYIVDGKTQGPRVELIDEYFGASEQRIHFYSPDRFLAYAQERGSKISNASVDEVEKVSTAGPGDGSHSYEEIFDLVTERTYLLNRLSQGKRSLPTNVLLRADSSSAYRKAVERVRSLEASLAATDELLREIDRDLIAHEAALPDVLPMIRDLREEQARIHDLLEAALEHLEIMGARARHPSSDVHRQDHMWRGRLREIEEQIDDGAYFLEEDNDHD